MKKLKAKIKGFTLIELLAVIVILAVIALIAVPIVLNSINDARKESFRNSAYGLVKSSEQLCGIKTIEGNIDGPILVDFDEGILGDLEFNGAPPEGGYIEIHEDCRIEAVVHNGEVCAVKSYRGNKVWLLEYDDGCPPPVKLEIGDYVQYASYYNEPILWRVIDIDEDEDPLLYSEHIIAFKAFDSMGEYHSPNEDRVELGSNYWKDSNIRQWLNSSEDSIDWIQNPPNADNVFEHEIYGPTNPYADEPGFLSSNNFGEFERRIVKPRIHESILHITDADKSEDGEGGLVPLEGGWGFFEDTHNYDDAYYHMVEDKVFFPSIKELKELVYDRGWEHRKSPTNAAYANSTFSGDEELMSNEFWHFWNRTHGIGAFRVRAVRYEGHLWGFHARTGRLGIAPAMMINLDNTFFISGEGTAESPYIIVGE